MKGRESSKVLVGNIYSEGPEAEDDYDEVHGVGEEHEDVHIGDSAVLWLNESVKEVADRLAQRPPPARERHTAGLWVM